MPFNATAADTRASIQTILASWAALVVDERGVPAPRREVGQLGNFLHWHVRWLSSHSAAADAATEIGDLTRLARRAANPDQVRLVRLGDCDQADCTGKLTAIVRSEAATCTAEIRCGKNAAHSWHTDQWQRLSERRHRKSWYSVREITQMWNVPPGSVYRHASQRQWRRVKLQGRTRYHHADVNASLGPVA